MKDKSEKDTKLLFVKNADLIKKGNKTLINSDERFHVKTINEFIKVWAPFNLLKVQILMINLHLFAHMLIVYNRYYSSLIYKLVARMLLMVQIDDVYCQDKMMWLGYPN